MIRGWYTGASGMNAQQNRLDAISNNLANVDTAGYKRDVTVSKNFPELLILLRQILHFCQAKVASQISAREFLQRHSL